MLKVSYPELLSIEIYVSRSVLKNVNFLLQLSRALDVFEGVQVDKRAYKQKLYSNREFGKLIEESWRKHKIHELCDVTVKLTVYFKNGIFGKYWENDKFTL